MSKISKGANMSGLTTHILDLTHGTPASDVVIELFYQEAGVTSEATTRAANSDWTLLKTAVTNPDGRLDQPILSGEEMKIGSYELVFHIGDYFRSRKVMVSEPPFLEQVPVRFGIAEPTKHYHVPLLVSPWGYQVYRGS